MKLIHITEPRFITTTYNQPSSVTRRRVTRNVLNSNTHILEYFFFPFECHNKHYGYFSDKTIKLHVYK